MMREPGKTEVFVVWAYVPARCGMGALNTFFFIEHAMWYVRELSGQYREVVIKKYCLTFEAGDTVKGDE
jgi:hypothetical protein